MEVNFSDIHNHSPVLSVGPCMASFVESEFVICRVQTMYIFLATFLWRILIFGYLSQDRIYRIDPMHNSAPLK